MSVPIHGYRPDKYAFTDHVVKVEHGVPVTVRVWPGKTTSHSGKAPWLFWMHGGGFVGGYPQRISSWIHTAFHERGYHIVSVGYRLCPDVSFDEQLSDIKAAWAWCHSELPSIVGQDRIDLSKSLTGGDSAGGCLASLSGHIFEPQPKVMLNVYGPVDVSYPYFYTPMPNANELLAKADFSKPRTEEELNAALWARDPSKAKTVYPWWGDLATPIEKLREYFALPSYEVGEDERLRMDLYTYMSIKRVRFDSVFRKDQYETEEDFKAQMVKYSAMSLLDPTKRYPRTFLMHGTGDTSVPVELSRQFYDKLKGMGIPVDAVWPEGAEHCFDALITGPDDPAWTENIAPCIKFVESHIHA